MKLLLEKENLQEDSLTNILRNDRQLKTQYNELDLSSGYYTVVGELLLNYFTDSLERDLVALTNDEKRRLIQRIDERVGLG